MKKILLLMILSLTLMSCAAQKTEALKPIFPKGEMLVSSIVSGTATISPKDSGRYYIVDSPKDLKQEWEYYFILEVSRDSEGLKTRPATIRFYAITPQQAAKNIAKGINRHNTTNK
jgi:hypothetical protein